MMKAAIMEDVYRYQLSRSWDTSKPNIAWIMLNPSTADDKQDDPTIRKCMRFSKDWGYGSLEVVNLFAFRSTDPKGLKNCKDPMGSSNDEHILDAISSASMVVAAWGEHGTLNQRGDQVRKMVCHRAGCALHALKILKNGEPGHPLYIKNTAFPFVITN